VPERIREDFLRKRPIEIREVAPRDLFAPEVADDVNHLWFRMEAAKGQGPQMQHCLMAYASDMNLLGSSLRPHGLTWFQGKVMSASLDHAMWFHGPAQFEDWHLYTMDAPFTGGARGFNRGSIYNQNGQLMASVAQEGLMRPYKPKPE
jgi:acyl-CoA thioesterase-2